jgi:hypothetical protein
MRKLLLSMAVALGAASLPGPAPLATVGPSYAATTDFSAGAELVHAKKKKKKTSKSSGKRIKFDEIGSVKRGKKNLDIHTTVPEVGLTCYLVIKYADGHSDTPDIIRSDENKNCVFRIDIPKRDGALGRASAVLYVYDQEGRVEGTSSQTFEVR